MKKFVDNNYGKDMINTYRGLLFSNLERSRAKDIEDVEAMNFVPQAAYGLSFNQLEYGIIPEAKNDTGIKLGDVINGAVGTQMSRYFQYSPKYEQTKIKFQPGKGKTIREKSAPMGYAYSREILDPLDGNYMFETTKKTEQTTSPTFVDSDVSTFNLPTIPDVTDFNYGKFGGRFACGGLKKYDGKTGSSIVTPSRIFMLNDGTYAYIGSDGNYYYNNGRFAVPHTGPIQNYDNSKFKFNFNLSKSDLEKLKNFTKDKNVFDGIYDTYIIPEDKIAEFISNPYSVTGIGTSTGATTGTTPSASTTETVTPESNSPATNTPATNTPTNGTTTTPSQQVVTDTKLPLGYAAFNYGNRLWGSYNKDAVLDNDRLLRYDAGDNGIHIRYQRIPRKEWKNRNIIKGGELPEVVVGNNIVDTDVEKFNVPTYIEPTDFNYAKCGGKMALGGPDYMNVDTELTDVVNEDVINRNLNKAFINGQWVDLTDQSTVRDAKIAQPRRDNWWATDMALWDGAKLAANVYDAIQQNKQRNKIRSLDDIAFTNYGDANPAYNYGNFNINGNPVGLDNYRNLVKPYHQSAFGGKYKCGGKYQNGGVYDLTPDEIREIYANGGRVEFLD